MLEWLKNNLGTMLVILVLVIVVISIIRKLVNDHKQGKTSCGCNCAHCALAGQCHKAIKTIR